MCNDFTPTLLNALGIHNSMTGEKGAANGVLEKMAIGGLLVSVLTPHTMVLLEIKRKGGESVSEGLKRSPATLLWQFSHELSLPPPSHM